MTKGINRKEFKLILKAIVVVKFALSDRPTEAALLQEALDILRKMDTKHPEESLLQWRLPR